MANNRFTAIWGGSSTGKTVLAVKIAKELASIKKNVLIIPCDDQTPTLPLLLPVSENIKSLGDLLSQTAISQISVLQHCISYGNSGYVSLLGYKLGDCETSYPEYNMKRAKELFSMCRRLSDVDYIIADCSHNTLGNILTAAALETADCVIRVSNANIRSTVYLESQKQLLHDDDRFHYNKQMNVLNNVLPNQDIDPFCESLGGVKYILPHCPAIEEQFSEQKLLESLFGKDAKKYEPVIKQMVKEIYLNE